MERNFEDEQSRQLMVGEKIGSKIIRTTPDAPDCYIYGLINQVRMHIKQSPIKSTKNHWLMIFQKNF